MLAAPRESRSKARIVLILRQFLFVMLVGTGFLVSVCCAEAQSRLANGAGASLAAVPQNVSPRATRAVDQGPAASERVLTNLSLHFNMTAAQQGALTQLLAAQQNPSSPSYHQWLTPEQYAAQFGLSSADLAMARSWLASQGFTVTSVARGGTFIQFTGTVGQLEQAFHTSIHTVSYNGEQHIANLTDPALPAGLASVVQNIGGLDDFRPRPHLIRKQVPISAVRPDNTLSTSQGTEHFMAPGDLYTIYDETPLINDSINGTGITIAVMGQVDISNSDVESFRAASGLSTTNLPTTRLFGTDPGTPTGSCNSANPPNSCTVTQGDLFESSLDVEWAGAAAPNASILFVTSTDVFTSLMDAIDNNLAPIMTISYGQCEVDWGSSQLTMLNNLFAQANTEGITITGPAGDDGATDCDFDVDSATHGLAVDFPASSPNVTGVGGTEFVEGSGTYWSATNAANGGSALSYIPEDVWNETAEDNSAQSPGFAAGGGGASIAFTTKPVWQVGTGVPADGTRDVPDVALNAAANHDGYYVCVQGSCTGGQFFNTTTNAFNIFGGTSVATPSFAGMLALVEQKIGSRIGNANPALYGLANSTNYTSVFHDVTAGNNDSPCTAGSKDCPNGGEIGFTAGVGYDQASGWGSVDATNMADFWGQAAAIGTTTGTVASAATVVASPISVTTGTAVGLAITVASRTAGTTTVPTGTVQVEINGAASGSTIMLSSGAASYSLPTTGLAAGTYTVSVVYSGDSVFAGSTGTATITVTAAASSGTPSFSVVATNVTVAPGSAATSTLTVTPLGGYKGTIAWTVAGPTTLTSACAETVPNLTVSAGTVATTAVTIETEESMCVTSNARKGFAARASSAAPSGPLPFRPVPLGVSLAGVLALGFAGRRSRGVRLLLAFVLLGCVGVALSGCGNSGSSTPTSNGVAPAGTYTLTVTGTDTVTSSITASTNFTLTIS
jgi:subtilase family serine protease